MIQVMPFGGIFFMIEPLCNHSLPVVNVAIVNVAITDE
ncbi:hypothetical protein FORC066_4438 [Yersinia enterocolitica]|uniref:Uncharacterized protein n=1 Tax=Yersinia enterocolitica W22703 TaxID=913028 RepID=F4MTZ2_YEREN|nr:hypothetical protein FORC065_4399 [Yersinia enterocolitica]UXD31639.1 hypothetical protein FORC066_4438 [Yersinia enterocolitica]CBX69300.1 unknown protein [Yersinia enterocolitica W22703]